MNPSDMQQPNAHDHMIDRTLAALGQAAPHAGLESRVLHALTERGTAKSGVKRRPVWFALPIGVCIAFGLPAILLPTHNGRSNTVSGNNSHQTRSPSNSTGSTPPIELSTAKTIPVRPSAMHTVHVEQPIVAPVRPTSVPKPEPLTHEEQLLQQIVRSGHTQNAAMLNPEVLARKEAESDAEFRQFFASNNLPVENP